MFIEYASSFVFYFLVELIMAMVRVHVTEQNGTVHVFESTEDSMRSITDMGEAVGVDLPYSCRSGACFTCCAEVTQ